MARKYDCIAPLLNLGITYDDAHTLRRVSMTLHRWSELECGNENGCVERDEKTGKTYFRNAMSGRRWPTPDRETGALKRLATVMKRYPALTPYVQGDPRGAALYVLTSVQLAESGGHSIDSIYNRGVCVY